MPLSTSVAPTQLTEQEAYEIGVEAYFYFYPLLSMEITRRQTTNLEAGVKPGHGPVNSFSHIRTYPDANFKAVVRPNFDTLYSSGWLDLTEEPMVVSAPDTAGRYYLLPMLDMWTDVFAAPGWRTTGTAAQSFLVVPPGWSGTCPPNIEVIDAPTPYVWIIGRTKTDGPDDYKKVNALQDGFQITPLSQWGKTPTPPKAHIDPSIDMVTPPLDQVNKMSAASYFALASELLELHAPHISDWSILARMKRIGLSVGTKFDAAKLDATISKALDKAAADALKTMLGKLKTLGTPVNGWQMNTDTMGVYGNFYMKRAIVAMVGLGANQPEDAIYPLNYADSDGKPLQGDQNYVLHFEKNQIPPVNAFWSITMYDAAGFQVANELDRFAISSWMPLKTNADGSLDIYFQHANPGADKESNWLPSPASGILGVTMRLYAPKPGALNGDWVPPSVKKVN